MSFSMRNFVMDSLRDDVGYATDREIRRSARKWCENGTLSESDVAEIDAMIVAKNAPKEMPIV